MLYEVITGGGGGGHAGGGGGVTQDAMLYDVAWQNFYGAGGGGGSSWAAGAGAGVTLPAAHTGWQTLTNNDPSQVVISVDCPSCAFLADCAMDSRITSYNVCYTKLLRQV